MIEYKEMSSHEVLEVAKLYHDFVHFLKEKTQDEYFNFETVSMEEVSSKLLTTIEDPSKKLYIAKEDKKIVGFLFGEVIRCFLPISKVDQVGYISGAFVSPEYRGRGIMKHLEQMVICFFKDEGLSYTELNILSKNELARNSWEKMGYQVFREQMRKKI